jgi:hypothetical protein
MHMEMIPERSLRHASVSAQRKIKIDDTLKRKWRQHVHTEIVVDGFLRDCVAEC